MSTRPSTARVLADVAAERVRQVARYGENDDIPFGTGPDAIWLAPYSYDDATQVERGFRADYALEGGDAGATWMRLLREELSEVALETDHVRLRAELIQLAALAASWAERIDRIQQPNPHGYRGYETRQVLFGSEWRWMCSCGRKGKWQSQSSSCCSYAHERHAETALAAERRAAALAAEGIPDSPCLSGCKPSEGDVCGGPRCT